jgi:hypothetical protein
VESVRFKIWYDDGGTYTDEDGPPELAPKRGVQAISQSDPHCGRTLCRADDFYVYQNYDGIRSFQGVDQFGLHDYLIESGYKLVLFGRTIGNQEYREVLARVNADDYLPIRTSSQKAERRG